MSGNGNLTPQPPLHVERGGSPYPVQSLPTDIIQVQIPLPFALNIVNCYLIRERDGWSVIDTGLVWEKSPDAWHAVLTTHNIRPRDLRRIIVTHHHPDHFGMAGWLQRLVRDDGGAIPPVMMTRRERDAAQSIWIHPALHPDDTRDGLVEAELRACDAPPDLTATILMGIAHTRGLTLPHPFDGSIETVDAGETLTFADRALTVHTRGGHSDGQMLLYNADDALIFCADHVLNRITPNIGLWPETEPHPLTRYLESLRELRDWNVRLALPGHKTLITDWRGRIDELLAHHDARLNAMSAAVQRGQTTVHAVARAIFDFSRFTPHEMRFAMVETLAHLDHLVHVGRVSVREIDGVWGYTEPHP